MLELRDQPVDAAGLRVSSLWWDRPDAEHGKYWPNPAGTKSAFTAARRNGRPSSETGKNVKSRLSRRKCSRARVESSRSSPATIEHIERTTGYPRATLERVLEGLCMKGGEHVEVLDYEKAVSLVEEQQQFAVGICSYRHEKSHLGLKTCDVPLESCTSMGNSADYLVRRNLARPIEKREMLDRLIQAREMKLVMNADNVTCKTACPIKAISLERLAEPASKKHARPVVDESICLGCGVCALACTTHAMTLRPRRQRVLYPEATLEKIILQSLEVGTLQNLLFAEPDRLSHQFLRAFVGAFLRLSPVKKALVSETLRSRFLGALKPGSARAASPPS